MLSRRSRCLKAVKAVDDGENKESRSFELADNNSDSVPDRWDKLELSWTVSQLPSRRLSRDEVVKTIAEALSIWASHSALSFTFQPQGSTDLNIRFHSAVYDDQCDGVGGTLAYAYLPQQGKISGNIHFDDAEPWTVGGADNQGIDLLQVAVHEIGHALGLDHSSDTSAIMYPTYSGYKADLDLDEDDIKGIQALYGAPGTKTPPPKAWERHFFTGNPCVNCLIL